MSEKNVLRSAVMAVCLLCAVVFAGSKQEMLEGIVAVVGDEVILKSDLDAYVALKLSERGISPDSVGAELPRYRKQFLDELIDGRVLLVHAKNDTTVTVTDDEVDRAVDNRFTMLLRQNNITMDSLEAILRREQGTTLAKFKAEMRTALREQILQQKVQRQYISAVKVSKRDVEEFYAQYHDSLPKAGESVLLSKLAITVAPPKELRQAAWEKMLSIKLRLASGADFAEMAKRFSEGPEAASGGDLGFIEKGTLNLIAFEQRAFSLVPGQTSDPFETPLGFHIVNVVERENLRVHVRQIFIKVAPSADQIKRASDLLDSIGEYCTKPADFIAAVLKYSTDETARAHDGRLGWSSVLELSGPLRAAVDTLPAGAITQVVHNDNELSIYRVDDRVKERALTLDDNWQIIADKAQRIIEQKKLIALVSRWRRQVFVSIRM